MSNQQIKRLLQIADGGVQQDDLRITHNGSSFHARAGEETGEFDSTEELCTFLDRHQNLVSNWYFWNIEVQHPNSAKRFFLRWLEKSDTLSVEERYESMHRNPMYRNWGELSVAIQLNENGERIYRITHRCDRSRNLEELDVHVDPLDARTISKYDDDGTYRPLKGAPTLQSGWVFPDLRHDKLIETIDYFYPASVVNWYYERLDQLDVTHYRDAADRHTGMFSVMVSLDSSQLREVTERCCTDSHCLKRRVWQESDEKTIPVPKGEGQIPCREPCQVLLNEARDRAVATDSSTTNE